MKRRQRTDEELGNRLIPGGVGQLDHEKFIRMMGRYKKTLLVHEVPLYK